jgi:hypothetical protein
MIFNVFFPLIIPVEILLCFVISVFSFVCFYHLKLNKTNIYMQIYTFLIGVISLCWGLLIFLSFNSYWYTPSRAIDTFITFVLLGTLGTLLYSVLVIFFYLLRKGFFK